MSMNVFLPEDLEAERMAIGCAIVSPSKDARVAFRQLWDTHFSDEYHGWLWGRLSFAARKVSWDGEGNGALIDWLIKDGAKERAKRFGGELVYDLYRFARPVLYWNLPWYVSRVRNAYRRRYSIMEAKVHLESLLTESAHAGMRGYTI